MYTERSLILKIKEVLVKKCGVLADPMGVKDTEDLNVPVVHPVLKLSEDHFKKNNAHVDGRYLREQKEIYKDAPEISFDEVVGYVFTN